MDDPESWRWIWVAATVVFGIGEMATPGSFFLAPFAVGALVAATLAFLDVPVAGEWAAFVGVSVASLIALRPLARRLDRAGAVAGVGSRRLIGRQGVVVEAIGTTEPGLVRVDREEWRATTADHTPIAEAELVHVVAIEGTTVIVTTAREHT